MKRCTKCQTEKPLSEMKKNKRFASGVENTCKLCAAAGVRAANAKYRYVDKPKDEFILMAF